MVLCSKFVLQTAGFDGTCRYDTSLQFAWSLTTLPYSPLPLHQSDKALVGQALFWKIQPSLIPTPSFQNYTDYFKCISAKGEDFAPCKQFKRAYHSLCPSTSSLNFFLKIPCVNLSTTRWMGMLYDFSLPAYDLTGRFYLQIEKWDDQRESGTFPASLEP
jgi:Cytochrome oxidase c subunit VIb